MPSLAAGSLSILKNNRGRLLMLYLPVLLVISTSWIVSNFGHPSIEQIIFHIRTESGQLGEFDQRFVSGYINGCVFNALLVVLFVIFCESYIGFYLRKRAKLEHWGRIARWYQWMLPVVTLVAGIAYAAVSFDLYAFVSSRFNTDDYFGRHYAEPAALVFTGKHPKNLVLIYAESLEATYSDVHVFGRDLLAGLKRPDGGHFEQYSQMPDTGWTIAGIVSTQCGIPLKVLLSGTDGNSQGNVIKRFLPGATCLPDTLHQLGFKNVFLGGASTRFAGKEKYLLTHHYDEIYGRHEWLATGRYNVKDMNDWGLQDDDLLKEAKQKLDQLEHDRKPFNLTLLTLSTHHPTGFISRECRAMGVQRFEEIVSCSAMQLNRFVDYMKERGYLENTRVVILGDHLAMPNPLSAKLGQSASRNVFNLWISPDSYFDTHKSRNQIVHFDVAPTILDFIHADATSGRYGLGYSGLRKTPGLPDNRLKDMGDNLLNASPVYDRLWMTSEKP